MDYEDHSENPAIVSGWQEDDEGVHEKTSNKKIISISVTSVGVRLRQVSLFATSTESFLWQTDRLPVKGKYYECFFLTKQFISVTEIYNFVLTLIFF